MTRVHLFQRYSGKENVVTNNTLLLLRRLYSVSPARLEGLLSQVFNVEVSVGVELEQQTRSSESVPDGRLTQRGLEVVIETKVEAGLYAGQLERHLQAFQHLPGPRTQQFLLAITPQAPSDQFLTGIRESVSTFNETHKTRIHLEATTFQTLIDAIQEHTPDFDYELQELIDDFAEFCIDSGLLPRGNYRLRAVPCGHSFQANLECGVYYEPAERSSRDHRFVGLYTNKAVRAVGEVTKSLVASIQAGDVTPLDGEEKLTKAEEVRILKIATMAMDNHGWDLDGNRFSVVDRFIETQFTKASKGGMRNSRYFDLGELLGRDELGEIDDVAEELREKTWE